MQFPITISSLLVLLSVATAAPTEEKRQVGSEIYATQTYFSGSGCTGTADGEATFGGANLCQSLLTVLGSVRSVTAGSVESGCTVHYYTDLACTQGDTIGVIGNCEQANSPFVATNVICPN